MLLVLAHRDIVYYDEFVCCNNVPFYAENASSMHWRRSRLFDASHELLHCAKLLDMSITPQYENSPILLGCK